MDIVKNYLDLLSEESSYLDRLAESAREKRLAILEGRGDDIVSYSDREDTLLNALVEVRSRRRSLLEERLGRNVVQQAARRGGLRRHLESMTSPDTRPLLSAQLSDYERRLRELRRIVKVNSVLLSDRIQILHHSVKAALSTARPKAEYQAESSKRRNRPSNLETALVLDQKA